MPFLLVDYAFDNDTYHNHELNFQDFQVYGQIHITPHIKTPHTTKWIDKKALKFLSIKPNAQSNHSKTNQ